MDKYDTIYEPAEDSFFMERTLKNYLEDKKELNIVEVGVGSGFVFSELVSRFPENKFSATDININAIKITKTKINNKNHSTNLFEGNLLEPITEKQDLIFFNTPYLPCEIGEKYESLTLKDKAIYGGKHGYEIIFQFIEQTHDNLKPEGRIFMLFSSLSKENKIKQKIIEEGFIINNIYREKHFMEELIIYEFSKSNIIKKIEEFGVKNIKYLTKGKRSMIYEGLYIKKKVICKTSETHFTEKENIFLQKLQKYAFVPKVYYFGNGIQIMDKCEGKIIKNFLDTSSKKDTLKVLQACLDICYTLDSLGFQKFELTNPYKHIFIDKKLTITFIDFERTIHSESPKNVGQFLQYIRRNIPILEEKGIIISKKNILVHAENYNKNRKKITLFN